LWLAEAKLRYPPGRPADLVDYLLARRDEPCGRTVPDAIVKAISWVEKVAEFPEEQRATHGRLAWAAKDKITEILSEGARLIKRAPRYPVYLLARLEHLVVDPGQAIGWRVWAWAKLVKVWGSLRWSDLQAIIPAELSLVEGRLVTTLRRTKTSGPRRRVRELPVAISEYAFFARRSWLQEGFSLLRQHANYKRDYLMPLLKADGALEPKPASYADAMVATAGLLATLGLPLEVQGYWTEHSERSVLPTALSLQDIPPHDKDLLGRWKPEGSDTYARSFGGRVARLQALFAEVARGADRYQRLDEREIAADLAELTVEGLRRSWREGSLGAPDPIPATLASEEPPLGEPTGDVDPENSSQASEDDPSEGSLANSGDEQAQPEAGEEGKEARFVCGAKARVPDMYNNATMGTGDGASGPADAEGPARAVQILETLRAMRQLVAEMAARLETLGWPWKPTSHPLGGGRRYEAMSPIMKQSLTKRLARHEQDAAKTKARAEAEVIAREVARKKKAEHDAKIAQAAMEAVKREAAKKREDALNVNAILREEQLELEKFEKDLAAAKKLSLGEEAEATDPSAASSSAGPSGGAATELSRSKFPPLPLRPEAKSVVRGRTSETTDTATTRRRSKSAANKSGVGPEPTLSWNDIFANANTYLRPLRAVCQDDPMSDAMTASDCKGTSFAVELFGRARPPLQSRANARPQGKGSYKLDLSWHAIDRDLWPLGAWNKALGEKGPQPRYKGGGKGKHRELDERAIWTISRCSEIAQLNETDRQGVCATPIPRGPRADFLATEVLPRGCYIYMEDNQVRTAIGAWDEDNAIFRCAIVCPI
ncbi:unnamed protein product, partial [Symbiodinium microadriaticum]